MDKIQKTEKEWEKELTPGQFHVMREKGTEPAFSGEYVNEKANGMYVCAACGNELFSSEDKFDSGTGWPSFTKPAGESRIELHDDMSHGMNRTEVVCGRCGAHLGHVFDDGPARRPDGESASGKRFCINSACLDLRKEESAG